MIKGSKLWSVNISAFSPDRMRVFFIYSSYRVYHAGRLSELTN